MSVSSYLSVFADEVWVRGIGIPLHFFSLVCPTSKLCCVPLYLGLYLYFAIVILIHKKNRLLSIFLFFSDFVKFIKNVTESCLDYLVWEEFALYDQTEQPILTVLSIGPSLGILSTLRNLSKLFPCCYVSMHVVRPGVSLSQAVIQHSYFVGFPDRTHTNYVQ